MLGEMLFGSILMSSNGPILKFHTWIGQKRSTFPIKLVSKESLSILISLFYPQFKRHGSDTKMLGEMLFGSIPMSSNGPIIKVHTFKMPPKLMLSKMFLLKPPKEQQ